MTETAPIIAMSGLVKRFGTLTVLHGINFDIERGEFFSLLGPSGCGKTTLLRILAGIEQPSEGSLLIDGQSMSGVAANRRPTNMVFQSYAIFPHLNVEENIGYGLRNIAISKSEAAERVAEALALVKLEGLGKRNAHQLSGGQRQRVALARALVCRPKVLLLDEPLSALDKKLREEMQLELRALQRTVGITFVFVTHDQEEALTLSDRIAVMDKGHVLQIDSPRGLYERPVNRTVAEFIGSMNLFAGQVTRVGADGVVEIEGPEGRFRGVARPGLSSGDAAVAAIRPERIRIMRAAPDAGVNAVSARLQASSYLGDRSLHVLQGAATGQQITVQSGPAVDDTPAGGGSELWLGWDAEAGLILPG
ncbi:MAG: ABC transporter ATP-binding protein [Rhodobacteraceae bacterium]|uniref:ABC transporter ATP-binding protein n=1 Tax=Albidovulum sp. TaxID=1872424 RepID=UPI001E0AB98D|nr:ABC transporter ATP-binding protein [Paracoccaceae bacterium]MCC0046469.1 ABC transporter ATP-binding protein [Defluviimonas sp.]HPE26168.1 ABC transporter ATP-binding protein [Albidovulum sp.]MCB2123324.1 ABC transporter ATP-binding protein [Paracoccaceae bacterium]MCB2143801.1 ABC transporter ATP-binding protein [Paracoccaceae bacterium]